MKQLIFFFLSVIMLTSLQSCQPAATTPAADTDSALLATTFDQLVHDRYSCKRFDPARQLSTEQLSAILEAGRVAPTAKNLQEQRLYVVQSADMLQQIDSITPCRYGAPTCIIVAYDTNDVFTYPNSTRNSGVEDATIVATHLLLAAQAQGVNSCWINFFDPQALASTLGLPANEAVVMMLDLGFAADGIKPLDSHFSRKDLSETTKFL